MTTKEYIFGTKTKICLIADVHFSKVFNLKTFNKLYNNIVKNKPNYVCIVGDLIDYQEITLNKHIEKLYAFLKKLSKKTKVIISLGNHDITTYKDESASIELFKLNLKTISNLVLLDNEKYIENNICFIGYTEQYETLYKDNVDDKIIEGVSNLTKDLKKNTYNILLSHNPLKVTSDSIYKKIVNHDRINLILSGHTHNGMLPNFIKTNTLFISPRKRFFVKMGRGYFVKENTNVVITGGVTKLGQKSEIFRYFNFLYGINIDYINIDN